MDVTISNQLIVTFTGWPKQMRHFTAIKDSDDISIQGFWGNLTDIAFSGHATSRSECDALYRRQGTMDKAQRILYRAAWPSSYTGVV
jgi:hypothetical protein